jgi:hypothetical protein
MQGNGAGNADARRLRVGVVDLVAPGPTRGLHARVLLPNFGTVMAQAVAVWCAADGHDVRYTCYVGHEDLTALVGGLDVLFVGAFTHSAYAAYALAQLARARGVISILGGPHARAYPAHAQRYFDYVVGLTDREIVREVLRERAPRPDNGPGAWRAAARQPLSLPGVRERWPYIQQAQRRTWIKGIPMLGSLGCPYTCSFCVDAVVDYQPLDLEEIKADLRFLLGQVKRPRVVWHDPNFAVRFDAYLDAIDEAVPPGRIDFVAESSLSLLSEPHLKRLQRSGFKAMLPGVESWFELGAKSKTGLRQGREKVRQIADHINTVLRYVPYVQTNFVLGLDSDEGDDPFDLTAEFIDRVPGTFAAVALLTVYGESAPIGESCRREGRLRPVPFHFMNSGYVTNVKPKHYTWPQFYDGVIRVLRHNFSYGAITRRHRAVSNAPARYVNLVRGLSAEGRGRVAYLAETRRRLDRDVPLRRFFEGETTEVPPFFRDAIERELGGLMRNLPADALDVGS